MVVGISTITIFAPITLLALINKQAHKYRHAALWSIISAFVVNVCFFTWGIVKPEQFQAKTSFIPAFFVASLVLIVGYYITKRKVNNAQVRD